VSRQIDYTKSYDELSKGEREYLDARHALRVEHERRHGHYLASLENDEGAEEADSDDVSVEEWVKTAKKDDIKEQLDDRGIDYPASANKDELAALLVEAVESEES
jgi:hypothetical protein